MLFCKDIEILCKHYSEEGVNKGISVAQFFESNGVPYHTFVLSDCVFGIKTKNFKDTKALYKDILKDWERFRLLYKGTGLFPIADKPIVSRLVLETIVRISNFAVFMPFTPSYRCGLLWYELKRNVL